MATDGAVCWQAIVENANDAVLTTDEAGTITFGNARAAALFGLERDALCGRSIAQLIPGADHLLAERGRTPDDQVELYGIRNNAGEFRLELSVARCDATGPPWYVVVVRDATEHARVLQLLAERDVQVAELTARMNTECVERKRARSRPGTD
jgi:PAS domain S-box-containing protein